MKPLVVASLAFVIVLTGCTSSPAPRTEPPPTTSTSPAKTQEEIEAEFLRAAANSCAKAQSENVVEASPDGAKLLALASQNSYKGFQYVSVNADGTTKVEGEWRLDICAPSYLESMAKEAGHENSGEYERHISQNPDGTFSWTAHSEGFTGPLETITFTVEEGFFTQLVAPSYSFDLSYGPLNAADQSTFEKTVDAWLAAIQG